MAGSMFADLAVRVLANPSPAPVGGFDAALWTEVETTGLDRLLLPEDLGGAGDAFEEAVAVMIALGQSGAALPLGDTMVANWCLSKAGLDVPDGPKSLLAAPDLVRTGEGLIGTAYWLPATRLGVLVSETDGRSTVGCVDDVHGAVGESACGEPLVWIGRDAPLTADGSGHVDLDRGVGLALGATLEAAAIVGALDRVSQLCIDYANTRRQFGRPIAKFQAVQILVARLASEAAASRAAVQHAAMALGKPGALFWAGVAKARASEAAGKAAAYAHQIHGAIGFTREYELHRYTRRLWTWRERHGNERYWNERIGSAALDRGGQGLWSGLVDGFVL